MGFRTQLAQRGRNRWLELQPKQIDAIYVYAAIHGQRAWKEQARKLWWRADPKTHVETVVYGLRNSHGITWLARYRLPVAEVR